MNRIAIAIFITIGMTLPASAATSRFDCTISMQQQCIEREGDCMKIGKPDVIRIDVDQHRIEECTADCLTYDSQFSTGVLGNVEFVGINKRKVRILGILTPVTGDLVVVSAGANIGTVEFGKCHPAK
jgi:hypothetical protein